MQKVSGLWWGPALGLVVFACAFVSPLRAEVVIETVTVGNPGNLGEWSGESIRIDDYQMGYGLSRVCGSVNYSFEIGKYEITAGQYTEFLNAVAADDPYGLYHTFMFDGYYPCGIERLGEPGSYTYRVIYPTWLNRPVGYVEWASAARFANWMHNGQPVGPPGPGTTEDGSYLINGATTNPELQPVVRRPGATWVLPSEDEWYKAAYHRNDGPTGNYWNFATQCGALPDSGSMLNGDGDVPSNDAIEPDAGNNANYYIFPGDWGIGPPYFKNEVGDFENSASAYGTFDQSGNLWEWTDSWPNLQGVPGSKRVKRGGSFYPFIETIYDLHAAARNSDFAMSQVDRHGFRLARVANDCNGNGVLDQLDLRDGTSLDANYNGRPDECDIAAGVSQDCDANGIPDEAEIGAVSPASYRWDDGTAEMPVGLSGGGSIGWLNHFQVVQGRETVDAVSISFDLTGIPLGTPVTIGLWSDPNADGNPADAVVLRSVAAVVEAVEMRVDLPATPVGPAGSMFFVGALMSLEPGWQPAMLDRNSDHRTSWLVSRLSSGSIDPANLGSPENTMVPMADHGYPGNWLVRALPRAAVTPSDCNANAMPDACDIAAGTSSDANQNGVPDECETSVGVDGSGLPRQVLLLPIRPNPFNPAATVRFALPARGRVTVQIFDVAGRLVRTLVAGARDAGMHEVLWDGASDAGRAVPSGSYFCRVQTETGSASARLMLLR